MMQGDQELALEAAKGDAAAFRALLERHYDLLFRVAYRFLGRRADAEDVAQEVAIGLASKIRQFRGEARFTTWIYRVVLNACRDHGRGAAGQSRLTLAFVEADERRQADWADSGERVRWLYQALDRLGGDLKETALLVLAEDMSHAEAGEILGVKESTVSWRMHELRKKLKVMAGQDHD